MKNITSCNLINIEERDDRTVREFLVEVSSPHCTERLHVYADEFGSLEYDQPDADHDIDEDDFYIALQMIIN